MSSPSRAGASVPHVCARITAAAACVLGVASGCGPAESAGAQTQPEAVASMTEAVSPAQRGKLIVRFSVKDRTEPDDCANLDVKDFELTLSEVGGDRSGPSTWRHQCEAFAMSLTLPPGTYTGSAVLVDAVHTPQTTRVELDRFTIAPNETVEATVSFPSSSFLE